MKQQQAYIPINFTGGGIPGIPNVVGDADSYFDLAQKAARDGRLDISEYLLEQAVLAEASGTAEGYIPGMPDTREPRNLGEFIGKSLATNAVSANPTPIRYNESMEALGFYNGIKSPEDISARSFQFLNMCTRNPIIDAAITTRERQAVAHAAFRPDGRGKGFTIKMKSSTASLSRAARKKIDEIAGIIQNGGVLYDRRGERRRNPLTGEPGVWDGNNEEKALSFAQVIAKMVRFSITYDFAPLRFEAGRDAKSNPLMFYTPVDPTYIRPTTKQYRPQIDHRLKSVKYVELNPTNTTQVIREFDWQLMQVMINNPELARIGRGFGVSKIEILVDLIASAILGFNYQRSYFDDSSVSPGIVVMKGNASPMGVQTREYLKQQIQQGSNSRSPHKLLYLTFPAATDGDPLKLIPMRNQLGTVQEMGWIKDWYSQLVAMITALLAMSPEEVNWPSVSMAKSTLSDGNKDTEFAESKEKGHVSFMALLAAFFQESIVERCDPDFCFDWCGLLPGELDHPEKIKELMDQGYTPNHILDMRDMPRMRPPLLPNIRAEIAKQISSDDYDTRIEYEDAVDDEYARAVVEMGKKPFSDYPNMPIGNPEAMQVMQMEMQQNGGGDPDEDDQHEEEEPDEEEQADTQDSGTDEQKEEVPPGSGSEPAPEQADAQKPDKTEIAQ